MQPFAPHCYCCTSRSTRCLNLPRFTAQIAVSKHATLGQKQVDDQLWSDEYHIVAGCRAGACARDIVVAFTPQPGGNRTDGADFDPGWIRNFLLALALVAAIWLGFMIANLINPARDYFDQFLLYVIFSLLVIYLGVAGWHHAETPFPALPSPDEPEPEPPAPGRDWAEQGRIWLRDIDAKELWRDPDLT